mmetsp:Transcript_727/g.2240  ORF Transcript_727/g.2240 Transcript_727/m.2240 type:complete len:288 (-) Transcript_727:244-1107(-)
MDSNAGHDEQRRTFAVAILLLEARFQSRLLSGEVIGVKMVDPHVAILTSARITPAMRGHLQGVDGSKVALDGAELVLEHHVEEDSVELAHLAACRGDRHGVLATADHHVRCLREGRDVRRIQRAVGLVHLEGLQGLEVEQARRAVFGGGDEERVVPRDLNVDNLAAVLALNDARLLARLRVPLADGRVVAAADDRFVEGPPDGPVDLARVPRDLQQRLFRLPVPRLHDVGRQLEHVDRGVVPHDVVQRRDEFAVPEGEVDRAHRGRVLEGEEHLARAHVPELGAVVC